MEGNGCRDKVSAYAGGGIDANLRWEQVKNVVSYSDSVRCKMYDLIKQNYLRINKVLRVKHWKSSHGVLMD